MIVFRLSKSKYSKDLSGTGAGKSGARWNSKGIPLLYTSESRALCTTEIAVHTPLGNVPTNYTIISIEIPNDIAILTIGISNLPIGWNSFPYPNTTQKLGDQFISEERFLVMKVPSVVVQGEYNFLINPNHKDFFRVKIKRIEKFTFNERLFKK